MHKYKILIIDDEEKILTNCSKMLTLFGYDPYPTHDAEFALQLLQSQSFDLILCDMLMPGLDGMEFLNAAKNIISNTPIVIFSAYGTIDRAVACMKAGAFDFIEKPFDADHFRMVIEKALNYRNLYNERNNLLEQLETRYGFENIIGRSEAMQTIFNMVESVAESDANIMITGESGTGKELIARSIHARSKRKARPFVPVNCGAFPENLFEAEICGFEKGAFTGANQRKIGLLEYADTGTFFLDEVCELPYSLQSKLLRVLQDKQLRRIGGHELIQIDVRLVSATNRDPQEYLRQNLLREDLYYRLNVINIHIPPLRDRREDIRPLADYFLEKNLNSSKKQVTYYNDEVIRAFENYNWPGNVRELENIVERAVALAKYEYIELKDLPPQFQSVKPTVNAITNLSLKQAKTESMEKVEKEFLILLLQKHQGNITKVSAEAEMTRRNTYRLLKKYNIDPHTWR